MTVPGYWMDETSGVLRPAVERYLHREPLSGRDIAALRGYFRQWMTGAWVGPGIADLRRRVDGLDSARAINDWLDDALARGIDPL